MVPPVYSSVTMSSLPISIPGSAAGAALRASLPDAQAHRVYALDVTDHAALRCAAEAFMAEFGGAEIQDLLIRLHRLTGGSKPWPRPAPRWTTKHGQSLEREPDHDAYTRYQ